MRISDWSSDVCSSDLSSPAPPATCPPAPSPTNTNTRNRVMAVKIEKKITGYAVVGADDKDKAAAATPVAREAAESELPTAEVIHMPERIERPEVLAGSTYNIKSPLVEHSMYETINDIVLTLGSARKRGEKGKRVTE